MPEYIWYIGFAISIAFALSSSIFIGRRIFKTGVEHFSSRILIISSIIDASLCGLLFLLQGTTELYRIIASGSFSPDKFIIAVAFLVIPGKIIWNYFAIQRKLVAKFYLKPYCIDTFDAGIASLCKTMGVSTPTILSSHLVNSPFVFGLRSSKAFLAIPRNWQYINDSRQQIQLLHELAHIRNHDIGFLAWSNACLRDLRFLFILLPALIVYSYFAGYSYTISSISLYLACSFILFVMLRYVVRKREVLADMTAALLIRSGKVGDVISLQEIHTIESNINSGHIEKPKLTDKIQRWLTDKALFAKKQWLWKTFIWIFNFFHASHPSNSERIRAISTQNDIPQQPGSSLGDSFWAGAALGLLGVVVGLGGYWLSMFTQSSQDTKEILHLSYKMYGVAAPSAFGFWVIFLTLPHWSSLQNPRLDSKFLFSQLKNHSIALAGACLICPVILTAGISDINIRVLAAMCVSWFIFIVFFGFAISIVSVFVWITIRYLQASQSTNLKKGVCSLAPFAIIVICLVVTGLVLMNNSRVFQAVNLIFSTFIGTSIFLLTIGHSRFSEKDSYSILSFFGLTFPIEGKNSKWLIRIFDIVGCPAILIGFGLPIYFCIDLTLAETFRNLSVRTGLLFLITSSCAILIFIRTRDMGRIRESKRTKVYRLHHCIRLFSKSLDTQLRKKINRIAAAYSFEKLSSFRKKHNLTINDAYEYVSLVSDNGFEEDLINQLLSWVLNCQQSVGFGLWSASSPRLYSTYQAILILQQFNLLGKCDHNSHISWIKTLQQPDGSFKGPWSKRAAWEDTFYAVKSIDMFGSFLDPEKTHLCRTWCSKILSEKGIKANRPDIIFYCFGALSALGTVDDYLLQLVTNWLSSAIEELLLTNISLNYENTHFSIMVYDLLNTNSKVSSPQLNLLSERIYTALKAELADIRL